MRDDALHGERLDLLHEGDEAVALLGWAATVTVVAEHGAAEQRDQVGGQRAGVLLDDLLGRQLDVEVHARFDQTHAVGEHVGAGQPELPVGQPMDDTQRDEPVELVAGDGAAGPDVELGTVDRLGVLGQPGGEQRAVQREVLRSGARRDPRQVALDRGQGEAEAAMWSSWTPSAAGKWRA